MVGIVPAQPTCNIWDLTATHTTSAGARFCLYNRAALARFEREMIFG